MTASRTRSRLVRVNQTIHVRTHGCDRRPASDRRPVADAFDQLQRAEDGQADRERLCLTFGGSRQVGYSVSLLATHLANNDLEDAHMRCCHVVDEIDAIAGGLAED